MTIDADERLLNDLLDGRLAPDEAAAVRARLEAEPALHERYAELERVGVLMRDWDPAASLETPDDFSDRVRGAIATDGADQTAAAADASSAPAPAPAPADRKPGRMFRMVSYAYAAAAVVVLAVTLVVTLRDDTPKVNDLAVDQKQGDRLREQTFGQRDKLGKKDELAGALEDKELHTGEAQRKSKKDPRARARNGGGFQPSGAVPPGLREPSDATPPPPAPPNARRASGGKPAPAGPVSPSRNAPSKSQPPTMADTPPESDPTDAGEGRSVDEIRPELREFAKRAPQTTYVLELGDLAEARAQLSLLLAAVEAAPETEKAAPENTDRTDGAAKRENLRGGRDAQARGIEDVLATLRAKGARLYEIAGLASFADTRTADEGDKPGSPSAPSARPPAPSTPAVPGGAGVAKEEDDGVEAPEAKTKKTSSEHVVLARLTPAAAARLASIIRDAGTWGERAEPPVGAADRPKGAEKQPDTGARSKVEPKSDQPKSAAPDAGKPGAETEVVIRIVLRRR